MECILLSFVQLPWMQSLPVTPSPSSSKGNNTSTSAPTLNNPSTVITSHDNKPKNNSAKNSEVKVGNAERKKPAKENNNSNNNNSLRTTKPLHEVSRNVHSNTTNTNSSVPQIGLGVSQTSERPICPPVPPNLCEY